jgi:tetratricopeptide (TPR) repeat protein
VRRLEPRHWERSLVVEQEVVAWSVQAEAYRRQGDFVRAESAFRAAARRLGSEPLDTPERAVFSRYLARLRQEQGSNDEALGLLQRAADLFGQCQEPAAAAEVWSERGWLCLDAGDPASVQPVLEQAVILLQKVQRPEALVRARFGLALAYAELGQPAEARQALASAQALAEKAPACAGSLRYLTMEARVAERLGEVALAVRLLDSAVPILLAAGAFYDAALAALELAQIYAAQDRSTEVARLRAALAPLLDRDALPERARSVLLFALHLAADRRDSTELLEAAGDFLERARERPWLRFEVARHPRSVLSWDLLEPAQRQGLCADTGLPLELAASPASELDAIQRDLITWTHELRREVRIAFDPPAPEEERRGPWTILRQGRAWTGQELRIRLPLLPEKFEVMHGRLLWSEEERKAMLALLLENMGVDEAVRMAPRPAACPESGRPRVQGEGGGLDRGRDGRGDAAVRGAQTRLATLSRSLRKLRPGTLDARPSQPGDHPLAGERGAGSRPAVEGYQPSPHTAEACTYRPGLAEQGDLAPCRPQ